MADLNNIPLCMPSPNSDVENQQTGGSKHTDGTKQTDDERFKNGEDHSLEEALPLEATSAPVFPDGGARAWSVAFGSAGVLFCTFGYLNAFGIFQEYYQTHQLQDQSPSAISWIGSIQTFFLFGGSLFGGPLFDRFGAKVIWPPAFICVVSLMLTSVCKGYYQFMLAQGILGGIAMGMTTAPGMAATGQYFNKKRAVAMGIAVGGSSLGGVIFPIAIGKMLANPRLGFGWTVRICGLMTLVILGISCSVIRARLPPRTGTFFLPSAFKNVQYTVLLGAAFLMMLGVFAPSFYLPSFAVENGMSVQLSSYIVAILNGSSFFGRLLPGLLADKAGRLNTMHAAAICTAVLILCWQKMTTNTAIIAFSVLYGFVSGAIISLLYACLAQVPKDPREIGTYIGMGMAVISIAALTGPPMSGALVSRYGGYDQVSTFCGIVVLAGGFTVLVVKQVSGRGLLARI